MSLSFVDKVKQVEEVKRLAVIPYFGVTSGKIDRLLKNYGLKTVYQSSTEFGQLLQSVKDYLGLRFSGVYKITCVMWGDELHKIDRKDSG